MLSDLLTKRSNPCIKNLTPYQPGKPIDELARETGLTDIVKLASNESPLGVSPLAMVAAKEAIENMHFYPDGGCYEIRMALSRFYKLPFDYFTMGNGSENLIEIIVKAVCLAGDKAVISQYTFATIPLVLRSFGVQMEIVPTQNWQVDCDAFINAITPETKIVFIVNPNNPTGSYVSKKNMERLLQEISPQTWVVVDEAYNEYISKEDYSDALPYLSKHPNLIIMRTFSKVYGLAGLRIGYAIAQPEVSDLLNRARLPFNVNAIASSAAVAALQDQAHVKRCKELNDVGMKQLEVGFKELNLFFIPSVGNFIAVKVGDAAGCYQKLLHKGVIVRPLLGYGMPEFLRVSIGTQDQNERLLKTLAEVL